MKYENLIEEVVVDRLNDYIRDCLRDGTLKGIIEDKVIEYLDREGEYLICEWFGDFLEDKVCEVVGSVLDSLCPDDF